MKKLNNHGITIPAARNSARRALAEDLPAPVIAELFGMHIETAVRWTTSPNATGPATSPTGRPMANRTRGDREERAYRQNESRTDNSERYGSTCLPSLSSGLAGGHGGRSVGPLRRR
jgi:hypothetical protein